MREIELKLEVDPSDIPLVREDPLLAVWPCRSAHQMTVYYDTAGTKLKKNGFTLRVRSAGDKYVQTVKPMSETVGLLSREEIECEVAGLRPELGSLREHPLHAILQKAAPHELEAIIVSDVDRTSWVLDRSDDQIQVDLDYGTISAGEHCHEFAELELELRSGTPAGLIVAARRLADRVPVRLGILTKAERGFLVRDGMLDKVSKAAAVDVRGEMDVAEAFEIIVHACLKHYRLNEPLVLHRRLANALHQARVAMRRLRSALTLFRPAIEDVEFQHLRNELRWFTSQLGDARNLDVYLERDHDPEKRADLTSRRQEAYERVIDAMNSHRFRRLPIDLVGWTAIGAWRSGKLASRPVESFATRRLDRLWKSIVTAGRDVAALDEHSRHQLRIQGKKLRYAIEFLRGLYPEEQAKERRFAAAIEQLQESLGKLNDLTTAKALVDAAPVDESWLIGSLEERRHLITAKDAMRELIETGPFWSSTGALVQHPG